METKVSDIAEFKIDTLVMGDDWQGAFDFLEVETTAKVLYLPRTPEVSTTQIKKNYIIVNNKSLLGIFQGDFFKIILPKSQRLISIVLLIC